MKTLNTNTKMIVELQNNKDPYSGNRNIQSLKQNIEEAINKHHKSTNEDNSHNFIGADKSNILFYIYRNKIRAS